MIDLKNMGGLTAQSFSLPEFIAKLQGFSLGLRHTHWETKSYALHKAAEQTQNDFDGLIDDFVEAYVGMVGGQRPTFVPEVDAADTPDDIISCLKGVGVSDSSLLNIRDEMLHVIYRYKYLKTLA